MVLPVRIELTTSALPRMRSTTELRQHEPFADLLLQQGRAYGLGLPLLSRRLAAMPRDSYMRLMNTGSSQRQQRLAKALRANLRLRKGQARERADDNVSTDSPDTVDEPPKSDPSPE